MTEYLFSADARWLWIIAMIAALFFPVRKLIFVMTVNRAVKKGGLENVDEAEHKRLLKRSGLTAVLLSFLFALFYVGRMFQP